MLFVRSRARYRSTSDSELVERSLLATVTSTRTACSTRYWGVGWVGGSIVLYRTHTRVPGTRFGTGLHGLAWFDTRAILNNSTCMRACLPFEKNSLSVV